MQAAFNDRAKPYYCSVERLSIRTQGNIREQSVTEFHKNMKERYSKLKSFAPQYIKRIRMKSHSIPEIITDTLLDGKQP